MAARKYLEDVPRDLQDLIYDGKKIEAIKQVRASENLDLKNAKERVEAIQAQLREAFPGSLPAASSGCASMIAVILLATVGAGLAANWMT